MEEKQKCAPRVKLERSLEWKLKAEKKSFFLLKAGKKILEFHGQYEWIALSRDTPALSMAGS